MTLPLVKRSYTFSDAELCMFTSNFIFILERDLLDLIPYGLSQLKIDGLKAKGDAFEVFDTDDYSRGMQGIATEEKVDFTIRLKDAIWQMAWRVETKWTKNSKQYRLLAVDDIYNKPDDSVLRIGRQVHKIMVQFLPDLADLGLSTAVLDDFIALTDDYETALNSQNQAIVERDANKQIRIKMGNEIYYDLVAYAELGKKLYAKTDPAKYNDYIIYDSYIPGTLTAPENLSVDVGTMVFSWSPVTNATSYVLLSAVMGSDEFETIYIGTDNFVMYVPPEAGIRQYKTKARSNSGYGPESAIMLYNHVAILPAPGYISLSIINANSGAIAINWEEVASAEFYRLFHSQTALNAPDPGEYTMLGEFTVGSYSGNVTTGYRHWFQVFAGNSELLSTASDSVMVDMPLVP
jgi:hypothetical protein